jgi:hypothetical protein
MVSSIFSTLVESPLAIASARSAFFFASTSLYLGFDKTFVSFSHNAHQNIAQTAAQTGHHTTPQTVAQTVAHAPHCCNAPILFMSHTGSCHVVLSSVSSNTFWSHILNVYSLFNLSKSGLFLASSALRISAKST